MQRIAGRCRVACLSLVMAFVAHGLLAPPVRAGSSGPDDTSGPPVTVKAGSEGGHPSVEVRRTRRVVGGKSSPVGARRANPITCVWYTFGAGARIFDIFDYRLPDESSPRLDPASPAGTTGFQMCRNSQTGAVTSAFQFYPGPAAPAVPAVSPRVLAERASAQLSLALPHPATSPGLGHFQLVGLPTWLWLTDWQAVSRTASIPGLSATVSATPVRTTWNFGSGGTVVCDGPGTPYDLGVSPGGQSTKCAKTFTQSGTYPSSVTVDWSVSWSASTGQAGTLPGAARTAVFTVEARAAQAVTD